MIASCRAANFRCNAAAIFSACNSAMLLPLLERLEDDEHPADVADVRAQQRRVAGHGDDMIDARGLLGLAAQFRHQAVGPLQARAVGKLDVDDQIALVLLGDEALGDDFESQGGHRQQAGVND